MNPQTNNPEEESDKIVILKFNYSRTKSTSKTFGELELKYISFGDLTFFAKLLDKVKDNKEFAMRVLHHQLITPKLSFTEFNKIPEDELIELARDFAEHEQHVFQYFRETTDAEFFANFREAIKTYYQKQVERLQEILQTAFGPMIESSISVLENFKKQYASIISQTTYITESIRTISKVAEQFREVQLSIVESLRPVIVESLRPVIEQWQLTACIVSEYLAPQIDFWQNWVEQNREIFNTYRLYWQTFQERYKITEQEAIQVLRKYKWFITPSLPLTLIFEVVKIGRKKGNQRKAINRLFVDYFSSNNFENLEELVEGWQTNEIFKPRMKIFRDCVSVMKNAKGKYNPSTIVLPTLIAQIDGIQREFMEQNGLSFDSQKRRWVDKEGNVVDWKKWFKAQTTNQELLDLANDIFLNILFQKSQPGKPLETPFTFNRHKIMHGEYLKYGRIDNAIRAFLILDFLATLGNKGG